MALCVSSLIMTAAKQIAVRRFILSQSATSSPRLVFKDKDRLDAIKQPFANPIRQLLTGFQTNGNVSRVNI